MYKKGNKYVTGVVLTPKNLEIAEYVAAYYNISRSAAIRMMVEYITDMLDDVADPEMLRGYLE